jgi:pimeloyl-ACP methyl ester carboxylesterase
VAAVQPPDLHVVRHHQHLPGLPVVLVHGAPDRSKNLAHVVHRLHDLPVTVYDRRGYGRSLAAGATGGGFDVHAADLIELLDGRPSVVVGQSAGGSIAMLAATRAPELFAALGVWEPPMTPWPWWVGPAVLEEMERWASYEDPRQLGEDFNRSILGDERWEGLSPRTQELLRSEGPAFRTDMAYQDHEFLDLQLLKVPFVVGWGTENPAELVAAHRRLAERTRAEPLEVAGADHFAHTNHPEAWEQLVRRTVELAELAAAER